MTGLSGSTSPRKPGGGERIVDLLFGLSVLGWAVAGLIASDPNDRLTPARLTITAMNAGVGTLFLVRAKPMLHGSPLALLASLPSLVLAGIALKLGPAPTAWPVLASVMFCGGGVFALTSFAFLGRSFAVLPALREVVVRGPYRLVRHPAYLGELFMVSACGIACGGIVAMVLPPLTFILVALRIYAEEELLERAPEYREYQDRVTSRLLPGVW